MMADDSVLRARIREAMNTGALPDSPPERMWGGPGSGASCAVCGNPVDKEEVEFELQYAAGGGAGAANYHVHARCFAVWELELRSGGGCNGQFLSQSFAEGKILHCERSGTNQGERS